MADRATIKQLFDSFGVVVDEVAKQFDDFIAAAKPPHERESDVFRHVGQDMLDGFVFGFKSDAKLPVVIETTARDVPPNTLLLPEGGHDA